MTKRLIDLARVKSEASLEQILRHYGVKIAGRGKQRMALCPFHQDSKPSCSVNLGRNVFHCFGCDAQGSVLDFVARIENISILAAAARVKNICALSHNRPQTSRATTEMNRKSGDPGLPLRPLPFRLKLDPSHPYLVGRGIDPELAAIFGLGYCRCGGTPLQGWICIPIHDEQGSLVAYAGRQASDEGPEVPKCALNETAIAV
jgi:DNA primase